MSDQDGPARHGAIETAVFGSEAVLYDERSGMVHHLNGSASAIWMLLDGRPLADVAAELSRATGLPDEAIRPDVVRAVADFAAAGLLAG
jgi:PqqD family protein of HPr-rel-A system